MELPYEFTKVEIDPDKHSIILDIVDVETQKTLHVNFCVCDVLILLDAKRKALKTAELTKRLKVEKEIKNILEKG